jgi:uncharacterized secreted protein with C-terminal beta-propeller domain
MKQKQPVINMTGTEIKTALSKIIDSLTMDSNPEVLDDDLPDLMADGNKRSDAIDELLKMIERVEVLVRYRGAMAQQILIHKGDDGVLKAMKHLYTHYDNLIKEDLGL